VGNRDYRNWKKMGRFILGGVGQLECATLMERDVKNRKKKYVLCVVILMEDD
jgi:hypothetical protein